MLTSLDQKRFTGKIIAGVDSRDSGNRIQYHTHIYVCTRGPRKLLKIDIETPPVLAAPSTLPYTVYCGIFFFFHDIRHSRWIIIKQNLTYLYTIIKYTIPNQHRKPKSLYKSD